MAKKDAKAPKPAPKNTVPEGRGGALSTIIGEDVAERVAAQLQQNLVDFLGLGLAVKQAHWNLVGPHFYHLHEFLDEVYEDVQEMTDETAERMRQLQRFPNGNADAIAADTRIPAMPLGRIADMDAIRHVLDRVSAAIDATRERLETFEEDEVVTADLVHAHLEKLEMRAWMLRAILGEN